MVLWAIFLHRRNLWVVHVLLDEVIGGKQPEMSLKKLEMSMRLPVTDAHKVPATSFIVACVRGNCYATVTDVSQMLWLSPYFRECSFLPHCQYRHLKHLWRSCRMILESGNGNEWRWNTVEPSCKDS